MNEFPDLRASEGRGPQRLAVHCRHLWRTMQPGRREPVALCMHPVREGSECIGPFLEDLGTDCGLWERSADSHLIPPPQPERWQRRRRGGYYDAQRDWR